MQSYADANHMCSEPTKEPDAPAPPRPMDHTGGGGAALSLRARLHAQILRIRTSRSQAHDIPSPTLPQAAIGADSPSSSTPRPSHAVRSTGQRLPPTDIRSAHITQDSSPADWPLTSSAAAGSVTGAAVTGMSPPAPPAPPAGAVGTAGSPRAAFECSSGICGFVSATTPPWLSSRSPWGEGAPQPVPTVDSMSLPPGFLGVDMARRGRQQRQRQWQVETEEAEEEGSRETKPHQQQQAVDGKHSGQQQAAEASGRQRNAAEAQQQHQQQSRGTRKRQRQWTATTVRREQPQRSCRCRVDVEDTAGSVGEVEPAADAPAQAARAQRAQWPTGRKCRRGRRQRSAAAAAAAPSAAADGGPPAAAEAAGMAALAAPPAAELPSRRRRRAARVTRCSAVGAAAAGAVAAAAAAAPAGFGSPGDLRGLEAQPAAAESGPDEQGTADPRVSTWVPPASPWGLIEEALYDDPWRLLVACILLNRTTGRQVRRVLGPLWAAFPTAEAMAAADPRVVQAIVRPLGLQVTRAAKLIRFSSEFVSKQWTCPSQLHGVGRYGADAYLMFCRGRWREVQPTDKDLRRYLDWLRSTGGEGSGLEREDIGAVLRGPMGEAESMKEEDEAEETGGQQAKQGRRGSARKGRGVSAAGSQAGGSKTRRGR